MFWSSLYQHPVKFLRLSNEFFPCQVCLPFGIAPTTSSIRLYLVSSSCLFILKLLTCWGRLTLYSISWYNYGQNWARKEGDAEGFKQNTATDQWHFLMHSLHPSATRKHVAVASSIRSWTPVHDGTMCIASRTHTKTPERVPAGSMLFDWRELRQLQLLCFPKAVGFRLGKSHLNSNRDSISCTCNF